MSYTSPDCYTLFSIEQEHLCLSIVCRKAVLSWCVMCVCVAITKYFKTKKGGVCTHHIIRIVWTAIVDHNTHNLGASLISAPLDVFSKAAPFGDRRHSWYLRCGGGWDDLSATSLLSSSRRYRYRYSTLMAAGIFAGSFSNSTTQGPTTFFTR